jgi:DNA-binding beta-propeller fold protein YncE
MKSKWRIMFGGLALLGSLVGPDARAVGQTSGLKLVQTVPLPGFTGDFDHFAVDSARGRLLLAAEDHATLEVFDLKTMKHLQTIKGFGAPHSILVRPGASTTLVTDSGPEMSKLMDASTYAVKGKVTLIPGADSIGYDAAANLVYVVTGGKDVKMATSEVAEVDPDSGKKLGAITTQSNHTEAMALEQHGNRLFVNLTDKSTVEVIDRSAMKKLAEWPVKLAQQNSPIAFDEAAHRLYLACRQPGMLVVMNSDNGAPVASLPGPARADDIVFDASAHRLYMLGGEGYIGVYDVSAPDHPKLIAKVPSAPGAKTGLLSPDAHKLYVAASPGDTKALAKVLVFDVQP